MVLTLAWELHGIIFVFNPDDDTHGDELDYFYDNFAKKTAIPDSNCLVLAFNRDETNNGNVKLCKDFWHKYFLRDHP
jgi:hypothetical protein